MLKTRRRWSCSTRRATRVDRLRVLVGAELTAALNANYAGRAHAAALTEELAAQGGDDRKLRFQLHEALRARGELTGAFNAILALIENPRSESEFGVRMWMRWAGGWSGWRRWTGW